MRKSEIWPIELSILTQTLVFCLVCSLSVFLSFCFMPGPPDNTTARIQLRNCNIWQWCKPYALFTCLCDDEKAEDAARNCTSWQFIACKFVLLLQEKVGAFVGILKAFSSVTRQSMKRRWPKVEPWISFLFWGLPQDRCWLSSFDVEMLSSPRSF